MVTLITEKLQNQSLDDLARKSYDAGPCSAQKLNTSGHSFPSETDEDKHSWKVVGGGQPVGSQGATGPAIPFPPGPCGPSASLGAVSARDLRDGAGPPSAPPTKRHCRSLSEPDELARCRSPWRPGGSRVWAPVSKRRCHSGGSATLQARSAWSPGRALPAASSASPPVPRPASALASSGLLALGPARQPAGPRLPSPRRRLSLSQEHLLPVDAAPPSAGSTPASTPTSTPASTPELGRRRGLLRCRSQPCVRAGGKGQRKRRREEDARWPRPALDFLKMTRVRLPLASSAGTPSTGRGAYGGIHPPRGPGLPSAGWRQEPLVRASRLSGRRPPPSLSLPSFAEPATNDASLEKVLFRVWVVNQLEDSGVRGHRLPLPCCFLIAGSSEQS
ncbi:protein FAM53A isoform X1 [Monodon monoceros]|uniref:protein FAM53A isoform X1 n=1 Tax=Monodon monoceros TaxID=40151 RepID=UPI0010F8460D|nr:protein FAM53A isoform X1 [Monodon monoceros]XP_029091848.1 protein FAM53A isoform X1 [Monodon monoceros]XP_029091849.1 protein FAM53A isoform X1 [Monodon monoceros]